MKKKILSAGLGAQSRHRGGGKGSEYASATGERRSTCLARTVYCPHPGQRLGAGQDHLEELALWSSGAGWLE